MTTTTWIMAATLGLAVLGALLRIMHQLTLVQVRVDMMWEVFVNQSRETPARGRRLYDRTLHPAAVASDTKPKKSHD